jgi:hypothetical protein
MIDLPVFGMLVAAFASGLVGALLGAAFVVHELRSGSIAVRAVELPRRLVSLDSISLSVDILGEQGRIVAGAKQTFDMNALGATAVQAWLDDHDMVAQPKGPDFKGSSLPETVGQAGR